ncbi:hypothetical protein SprV_0200713900 [Sparganum proliferum]
MRIDESGTDSSPDAPSTSSTPTIPSPASTPPPSVPTATNSIIFSTSCMPTVLSPTHNPSPIAPTTTTINITETDNNTAVFSCSHCSRTFISRINLVSHLRICRTETGEPTPGTPTYTRRIRLHSPHCTRTFIHRMGLLGHMSVHENLRKTIAGCTTPSHPPSPASHRTSTSPTASTQLPPSTQVGRVRLGSPATCVVGVCDEDGASSAVAAD